MTARYLALALKVAIESTHPKHAMGAVVVKGGAVLAQAANTGRRERCAERRALKHRHCYLGATIYVMRLNGKCSRPCDDCLVRLREEGIREVVYVATNGLVVREAL